jgi:hypothetical protein
MLGLSYVACSLSHVLMLDNRKDLLDWYCSLQFREYRRIFRASDEVSSLGCRGFSVLTCISQAGQLDNLSRRFAWFRRTLKVYEEEHAAIFPEDWNVGGVLVGAFGEITRSYPSFIFH